MKDLRHAKYKWQTQSAEQILNTVQGGGGGGWLAHTLCALLVVTLEVVVVLVVTGEGVTGELAEEEGEERWPTVFCASWICGHEALGVKPLHTGTSRGLSGGSSGNLSGSRTGSSNNLGITNICTVQLQTQFPQHFSTYLASIHTVSCINNCIPYWRK